MPFNLNIEPLNKWPEKDSEDRKNAPFKASWSNTLDLLMFELEKISARNVDAEDDALAGGLSN